MDTYLEDQKKRVLMVSRVLGMDAKEAFMYGEIGFLTYDENYTITWISELLEERGYDIIGRKVTAWLPTSNGLFTGDEERITVEVDDYIYEVVRKEDGQTLFLKDVTVRNQLSDAYDREQVVLGLIHLDNYEETIQYEEEQKIAFIDSRLRQPMVEWAKNKGIFVRRIKNDRYLLLLNEKIFSDLMNDRFSILNYIRNTAQDMDVAITLSMSFARGTSDFIQLEEMVNSLLELAQSRGGDQIAIKRFGEEVKYFGGSSEAQEKRSKVRVRVIAQTLRDLIQQSSDVLIVGHKEMDFDCLGASICISRIVQSYGKTVRIVTRSGGVEAKLANAIIRYKEVLNSNHHLINEAEALDNLNKDTLVIMVDHHINNQSNAQSVIEKAKKVVVIDHHRRNSDFNFTPVLVYLETAASSTSELVTELIPYQTNPVQFDSTEATLILTGILIDTNRFRNRTGSRTFEAASLLKKYGADTYEADDLLKDDYTDFEMKTKILKNTERVNGFAIASLDDGSVAPRAILSQVADSLLSIKEVEAAFVIANIDERTVALSARSKGKINVHALVEKMSGGGHFSAAALQRENTTVAKLKEELEEVLKQYLEEEELKNESNIA
jgi:c-di-AMP phosphodiesterase-like protein